MNGLRLTFQRTHEDEPRTGTPRGGARTLVVALVMTLLLFGGTAIDSCPYCISPPQSLSEQVAQADLVIIAELVRFRTLDNGLRPESTLRIREYLNGQHLAAKRPELSIGRSFVVDQELPGARGSLFLMYGTFPRCQFAPDNLLRTDLDYHPDNLQLTAKSSLVLPEFISWNESTAISREAVSYLRSLPRRTRPQSERLTYFLNWLEHSDPLIAMDAWAEFGNARYEDVLAVRHLLPREKLLSWVSDRNMNFERLGLYGMMLGLCGHPEDAQFLLDQMHEDTSADVYSAIQSIPTQQPAIQLIAHAVPEKRSFRFGAEGLMGGYLLLTGATGLDFLDRTIATSPDAPELAVLAMIQALQFVREYEPKLISEDRLQRSMASLLSHRNSRELVIASLARWEAWDLFPQLQEMFEKDSPDDRATRMAIVQFAQSGMKAAEKDPQLGDFQVAAASFLRQAAAESPDLFSSNTRDFGVPQ